MPVTITVREDLGVIQIESSAVVTVDEVTSSLAEVVDLSRETGLTSVLIDHTEVTVMPSTISAFAFGNALADVARGIRFAVVAGPARLHDVQFVENVVANRGGELRIFDAADDALAWLEGGPDSPTAGTP